VEQMNKKYEEIFTLLFASFLTSGVLIFIAVPFVWDLISLEIYTLIFFILALAIFFFIIISRKLIFGRILLRI
jgi:hypothetical protein